MKGDFPYIQYYYQRVYLEFYQNHMIDIPIMLAKLSVPIMILESLLLYSDQQSWDQLEQWVVRLEDPRLIIFKRFQSNPQMYITEPLCQTWNGPWNIGSNLTLKYYFETISLLQLHIVEVYQWISYALTWLDLSKILNGKNFSK